MNIREGLTFDDVLLVPMHGVLDKRADADLTTHLVGENSITVPILSAPMASVTEDRMATAMRKTGAIGVLHRFNSIDEQVDLFLASEVNPACAIGIHDGLERVNELGNNGAEIFVLDVAHAHTDVVLAFIKAFTTSFSDRVVENLIVGNIATAEGAYALADLGVGGVKVGIGPGAACTTREVTGFGVPQLTAIMDVAEALNKFGFGHVSLIADGGIKNSGDIVKALAAGADSVMIGSLLAGADEAPFPGEYFGMASHRVNGHNAPEGIEGRVERTGPVSDTIKSLAWGIRSGLSYAGATNIRELQENAEFVRISAVGQLESATRLG